MVKRLKLGFQERASLFTLSFICIWAHQGLAFDYLEHSYLSDRACLLAQRSLGHKLTQGTSPQLLPRLLVLTLSLLAHLAAHMRQRLRIRLLQPQRGLKHRLGELERVPRLLA